MGLNAGKHEPAPSPLVIWGAGAMGGSIGAALVKAGRSVLFVDKDREHVQAMNLRGLCITGPIFQGQLEVEAVHPDELLGRYSTIFLCVKGHHRPSRSGDY